MGLFEKIHGFISEPRQKMWWAKHNFGRIPLLVNQRRLGALAGYMIGGVTGRRIYDRFVDFVRRSSGETIEQEIRGNRMILDLCDQGLSRDLFIYGIREERGTELFERELSRVAELVDNGVAVEIGANIGYFALMELDALGDSASLVAFEPDERNARLLAQNLKLNGYQNAATIERAAVGPECGVVEFERTDHSNLNKVRASSTVDPDYDTGQITTVEMWSVDDYLRAADIDLDSVVAARMDVEGYEIEVLRGMEQVLATEPPFVLSLEIHPGRLHASEIQDLGERLDAHGFELVEALSESITAYPFVETNVRETDSIRSIPDDGPAYNVIAVKWPQSIAAPPNQVDESEPIA